MDSNLPKVSVVALRHPQFQNLFLHGLRSDNQKWTLPGGHANPGETPKETASRELKEETGLEGIQLEDARNDQLGKESDRVHVHLFTGVCPEGKKLNATSDPDSEFVTYKFLDPSNHDNMHIDSDRNILLHHLGSMIHKTITLEKENEIIAENKKKPEAKVKHKFKAAHWTHPNGHPRCFICGDEERIDGECVPETTEDLGKSKNVREQKKKVFGTQSTPPKGSEMREKHIQHIKDFTNKFLGIDLKPSGGKINEKTGLRRAAKPKIGIDKPDWRSGQLEAQWNPDAIVHEIAHLMLLPKGIGLQAGQKYMDKQYGDIQGKYGYMSQKRSQGEVQPMAAENIIRRHLGLPATNVGMDVGADPFAVPERTSVEDPNQVIGNRVPQRKPNGDIKWIDLVRQSQFLSPTNKQRLEDIFNGKLKFHHQNGWVEAKPEHPKRNLRSLLPHKAWKTEPAGIPQHFSMISAQHNEVHNKAAHEKLRQELSNHGFQPQEVTGHYGYPEKSFMVPHTGSIDDRKAIEILGGQFGQESVLHSSNLKNHLVHLQDPSKSKEGVGHSNDFSDNMFTELPGGHKMKLNLNKGDEDLLYHYSRHEEPIDEIDPAKHGTGTPGAERKRSPTLPRSYYYDTPVGHEPDVVSGARHLYRILKPKKIIDINGPEAKIYKEKAKNQYGILDHNALEQHLRDAGYHGYKNTGSALPNVVALFDKQKVHSEGKISKLGKKMLNPEMGVSFKVHPLGDTGAKRWPTTAIGMNKRFDPKQHDVRITAHLPNGQQIGTTDLVHSLAGMNPINIQVDPKFQRKGIGSAMYQHAEKHTGKKVIPSIDQSPDAQKFWKQKNRNFGR